MAAPPIEIRIIAQTGNFLLSGEGYGGFG